MFPNYETIAKLGEGAQGQIHLIRQKDNNQLFVLKTFSKYDIFKSNSESHMKKELEVLSEVRNLPIATLYECTQDENNVYYLMQYVPGLVLSEYLGKNKGLSLNHSAFYIYQCLLTLSQLHSQNIVYRDIKPSNIIIDQNGYLQFIDFGYAKKLSTNRTYTFCGTPHYMAPEIVNNSGHSYKADYWSLGIMFYEMLCGEVPFDSHDPFLIYTQIREKNIIFPKSIDKQGKRVIIELTQKDEEKRNLRWNDKIFQKLDKEGINNRTAIVPYMPQS